MSTPPNILYLNSHDTGRVIGPMGYRVRTPHLQRLADEGVLLRNCHCAAPTCSPSRAALITGMVPHSCGMFGLGHRGWSLVDPSWTLPSHLGAHGYSTATWGMAANHCDRPGQFPDLASTARGHGYDRFIEGPLEGLLTWLEGAPGGRPFFLNASWLLTHRHKTGFNTPPDPATYDPRYTLPPPPLADVPEVRADWAHFLADISEWDRQIGLVLAALERSGRAGNTLIVVTTDHGPPFPGLKCHPTVHGTGVFCLLHGPGGFTGGLAVDHLLSQLDLFPTLCAVAGVPVPTRLHGVDLRPTLSGQPVRDYCTAEVTYHAAYEPWRAFRTAQHLYVRRFGERRRPVVANCDASPSRDHWLQAGWQFHDQADEELYDSALDPQERQNLIGNPHYAGLGRDLRARLEAWMVETADPLLHGPVALAPGCRTTSVDAYDPNGLSFVGTAPR